MPPEAMKEELPAHLTQIRDILMQSAGGTAEDEAPRPPSDLLDDLERALMDEKPVEVAKPAEASLFEKLRSLFATPAFGGVAALIVVLFVAVPMLNPGGEKEVVRGGIDSEALNIILVDGDDEAFQALSSAKNIDAESLIKVASEEKAAKIGSPKIVVIGNSLKAYDGEGNEVYSQEIADASELGSAVAMAMGELNKSAN